FFFQAEDGIRDFHVTGVQTCALPILSARGRVRRPNRDQPYESRKIICGNARIAHDVSHEKPAVVSNSHIRTLSAHDRRPVIVKSAFHTHSKSHKSRLQGILATNQVQIEGDFKWPAAIRDLVGQDMHSAILSLYKASQFTVANLPVL